MRTMVQTLFLIILSSCCGYALLWGGREGRLVSAMFIVASLLTYMAVRSSGWSTFNLPVFAVDLLLLIGLWAVALSSRFYWPIWICGMHTVSVATHFGSIMAGDFRPGIYQAMEAFWSIPELLAMVVGIMIDRRAGLLK